MKKVVLLSALMLSAVAAKAEVKMPGEFIPTMCSQRPEGARPDIIAVEQVCLGKRAQMEGQALAVYVNDGTSEVFDITVQETILRLGANTAGFQGESVSDWDSIVKGQIITIMGIRKSISIKLETNQFHTGKKLKFQGNLEAVYVTL